MQELQTTIDVAQKQSFEAAREIVLTNSGKNLMDGIRATIAEMTVEENSPPRQSL